MCKLSASRDVMLIRNVETRKSILVPAPDNVTEYKGPKDQNVLLFHRIGDRYFLAEVKTAGVRGHVPASRLEHELTAGGGRTSIAAVIVPAKTGR